MHEYKESIIISLRLIKNRFFFLKFVFYLYNKFKFKFIS